MYYKCTYIGKRASWWVTCGPFVLYVTEANLGHQSPAVLLRYDSCRNVLTLLSRRIIRESANDGWTLIYIFLLGMLLQPVNVASEVIDVYKLLTSQLFVRARSCVCVRAYCILYVRTWSTRAYILAHAIHMQIECMHVHTAESYYLRANSTYVPVEVLT